MDSSGVTDIVVTAERRSVTVQKSSLAIDVVGEDELRQAGVSQAKDLVALVPGLQIAAGGNTLQTFIRGVGDVSASALVQSAVAYNVDGIYIGDTSSVSGLFYDVARVEVLKGPQGTLYGRNSSAGALNIITNRPRLGHISGGITFELGNYDNVRGTAAINVPLGQTAALRAAGNYVSRDGYLSDGGDDDKQRAARLQLLWQPTDRASLIVSGDVAHRTGRGAGSVLVPRQAGNGKFTGNVDAENNAGLLGAATLPPFLIYTPGAGLPPAPGVTTGLLEDSFVDNLQHNINAEFNYDFGGVVLTFIPAYRHAENSYGSYLSGSPFLNYETIEQQSYELRLSHDSERLHLVAGVYYLDLDQDTETEIYIAMLPGLITKQFASLGTKSYAAFGQATVNLSDDLRLIGGGRYTRENRTIDTEAHPLNAIAISDRTHFNSFSFRAGLEYDLTPENMLYATVSKGFKSGGFNIFAATPTVTNVYRPETLTSYTLGVRNRFLDNTVQFNLEGFYWDYKDSQQSHLGYTPVGALQFLTYNAASATIYGFDADLVFKPTPNDVFTATVSYLHSKFDEFIYEVPLFTPGTVGCAIGAGSDGNTAIDCSGQPLPRAPRWSGTAGYQHRFEFGNDSSLVVQADISFASRRYTAVDYIPNEYADSYIRQNASITYNFAGDAVSITAYIKNISNEEVHIGGVQAAFSPGYVYNSVDAPRTYGLRLTGRF